MTVAAAATAVTTIAAGNTFWESEAASGIRQHCTAWQQMALCSIGLNMKLCAIANDQQHASRLLSLL